MPEIISICHLPEWKVGENVIHSLKNVICNPLWQIWKRTESRWFPRFPDRWCWLLHAGRQGMRKAFLRAPLDFNAHQLAVSTESPAPDHRQGTCAQGHRLRRADRHADLRRGRRPHRVRRAQGATATPWDQSRPQHHDPLWHIRASASRRATAARCGRAKLIAT